MWRGCAEGLSGLGRGRGESRRPGSARAGWSCSGSPGGDTDEDGDRLAEKVINLRAFADDQGKMNRSVVEAGSVLVVSQFTLLGDCRGGPLPELHRGRRTGRGRTPLSPL